MPVGSDGAENGPGDPDGRDAGHRASAQPFWTVRPRLTRGLTVVLAPIVVIAFALLSWYLTATHWRPWHGYDVVWMNLLGVVFGLGIWRLGAVRLRAFPDFLEVRNFIRTTRLAWPAILDVTFHHAGASPWATLDLSDGTVFPVAAIQVSEGERGLAQAMQLRRLIAELGTSDAGAD